MQKRTVPITAPHQGILVSIEVNVGDAVQRGQRLAVMEAMKMEFIVEASCDGVVREIAASMKLSEGAVKYHLHAGRGALRDWIGTGIETG